MDHDKIKDFISSFLDKKDRTLIIIDYGNVEKWKESLHWDVGIRELAKFVKHFSSGAKFLRRFYYGADYGRKESGTVLGLWSKKVLQTADYNHFEVINKRVKYIHSKDNVYGFEKKCDLDVEMTVDMIKERDNYDTIILFSGDGDLMYAIKYLHNEHGKKCYVFGARDHVGREVYDAKKDGVVENILYAEDFECRLNSRRWFSKAK